MTNRRALQMLTEDGFLDELALARAEAFRWGVSDAVRGLVTLPDDGGPPTRVWKLWYRRGVRWAEEMGGHER